MDTTNEPTEERGEEPQAFERAAPITSRFLFVDIAAMRAKQLRRGALPRLDQLPGHRETPVKLERIAMEEVKQGIIHYDLPDWKALQS